MLVKLSAHYWRPDFSEGQARQLIADFIDALTPYSLEDIERAVKLYYTNPGNKFFPHPGALIGLIRPQEDKAPIRHALTRFDQNAFDNWPPEGQRAKRTAAQVIEDNAERNRPYWDT